jgi:hypothetical protein
MTHVGRRAAATSCDVIVRLLVDGHLEVTVAP